MDTAESVSKGCFAFRGKKKIAKSEDYFCKDSVGLGNRRWHVFQSQWENMDTEIQILRSDLNTKIFDDLLKFVGTCHSGFSLSPSQTCSRRPIQEIPTAAFVTGVNTPDHAAMFATLVSLLKERVSSLVAILRAKECSSKKSILSRTLGQLLGNPHMLSDDEDDSIDQKNLPCTLSTLAQWYKDRILTQKSSPKKRRSTHGESVEIGKYPLVIIVFEDLESFQPQVLQDFLTICSNYLQQLPLVMVFGIATAVAAVHRLLPNSVSSLLCMEKFQAPPSTEYLTEMINQILMTDRHPFKLGSKVFQLLLDIFLFHDFSVLSFVKGLKFALLDHYSSCTLTSLCCPLDEIPDQVKQMDKHELEELRRLPSFMKYVESRPPSKQVPLLTDDKYLKNEVVDLVTSIHTYHSHFFPMLRCLHTLTGQLPHHPLGKQLREMYSMALESSICDCDSYKEALDLLKMMSKDELILLIQKCSDLLRNNTVPEVLQALTKKMTDFCSGFNGLQDMEEDDSESPNEKVVVPEKTDLHHLRQTLKETLKKKKKLTAYEKLRVEAVDFFDGIFRKYLPPPQSFPLHELLYYDSVAVVKRHLNASTRSAIQTALGSPHFYLECDCCKSEPGLIQPTMPDVCIVYRLHLECGHLINLYDWLQAFVTVVTEGEEDEDGNPRKPDQVLQARFIRAVSELQFLGFIKPTKRKTDHVARLTWGGC